MNNNIAAPKSINYGDQLPLGIESRSQQKLFFPTNGDVYSGDNQNICRLDISYDGLIDFSNSYLQFEVHNKTGFAYTFDMGQPLIERLRIECGGVVLEDIQNYNHLLAGILAPCQNGIGNTHFDAFNSTQPAAFSVPDGTYTPNPKQLEAYSQGSMGMGGVANSVYRPPTLPTNLLLGGNNFIIAADHKRTIAYKLVSGLLDNDKFIPTVLLNAPITIEITWAPSINSGCIEPGKTATGDHILISKVRYVAHTIDLERSFYDRLRMVQQSSGGVLQIAGTSYRNYTSELTTVTGQSINIPARLRSIKSVFWKAAKKNSSEFYGLSAGGHGNISAYQLKIGGNSYPPTKITTNYGSSNAINKVTPYLEVMKAFGKVGSTVHSDMLNPTNYLVSIDGSSLSDGTTIDFSSSTFSNDKLLGLAAFAPYGLDLESFRHEIENGVNTSAKALTMYLEFDQTGNLPKATPLQVFIMYDSLFYINMDGTISVST